MLLQLNNHWICITHILWEQANKSHQSTQHSPHIEYHNVLQKKKNHFLGLLSSPSGLRTSGPGVMRINDMRELFLPVEGLPECRVNGKVAYLLRLSASCSRPLSRCSILTRCSLKSPSRLLFSLSQVILAFLSCSRAPSSWQKEVLVSWISW